MTPAHAARVTAPVLTVHGTVDRNAPYGGAREWAGALPGARLLTVEGAAHAVLAERDLLPELASFLGGDWPAGAETVTLAAEAQLSQLQALELLRAARDFHRPEDAPPGRHLRITLEGDFFPRGQSRRPEPPWSPFPVRQELTIEPPGRHLAMVEEVTWGDFVRRSRSVVDGSEGFDVDLDQGRVGPPSVPPAELRASLVRRTPALLLEEVLNDHPGSLRLLGVERDGEAWVTARPGRSRSCAMHSHLRLRAATEPPAPPSRRP